MRKSHPPEFPISYKLSVWYTMHYFHRQAAHYSYSLGTVSCIGAARKTHTPHPYMYPGRRPSILVKSRHGILVYSRHTILVWAWHGWGTTHTRIYTREAGPVFLYSHGTVFLYSHGMVFLHNDANYSFFMAARLGFPPTTFP